MAHARNMIRTDLETRIGAIGGLTVFDSPARQQETADFPSAAIWISSESADPVKGQSDKWDQTYQRTVTAEVTTIAATMATLEANLEAIEEAMAPSNSNWLTCWLTGTEFDEPTISGSVAYSAQQTYEIQYTTTRKAVDTIT